MFRVIAIASFFVVLGLVACGGDKSQSAKQTDKPAAVELPGKTLLVTIAGMS